MTFSFPQIKQATFVGDLSKVKSNSTELSIHGDVLNIGHIERLPTLNKLYLRSVTQAQFDVIIPLLSNIQELLIYELRCHDLSALSKLNRVEKLELSWNTKAERLWDMSYNTNLHSLLINDFSKLHDISALEDLRQIKNLSLTGGVWNKLKLDSLLPLQKLSNLRTLELLNLSITDPSQLQPLSVLTQLEELQISNQFPTEEYARLSVLLPHTICNYFQPYKKASLTVVDEDIIITGRRKPWLNSKKDAARIEKYTQEFHLLQEKYRVKQK